MSFIRSDKKLHRRVSNCTLPFTANFIIIPNFMNILARASSLGPLMFFTFDHLLCPAHKAGHSCRVLAGVVLQGRLHKPEAGRKNRSARTGSERKPGCRARRAPSTAAGPAMPFTHWHTTSNLLHRRSKKLIQETTVKNLPLRFSKTITLNDDRQKETRKICQPKGKEIVKLPLVVVKTTLPG